MPAARSRHHTSIPDPPLLQCSLWDNNDIRSAGILNLVADRLRVNKHVHKVASWVDSAVARRIELWEETPLVLPPALAAPLVLPPALAARAAVLAFGDELLDLVLPRENQDG